MNLNVSEVSGVTSGHHSCGDCNWVKSFIKEVVCIKRYRINAGVTDQISALAVNDKWSLPAPPSAPHLNCDPKSKALQASPFRVKKTLSQWWESVLRLWTKGFIRKFKGKLYLLRLTALLSNLATLGPLLSSYPSCLYQKLKKQFSFQMWKHMSFFVLQKMFNSAEWKSIALTPNPMHYLVG